jgi:D-glycero-alpha-D-manno-heptose 1-phosphate guanylyltransferase
LTTAIVLAGGLGTRLRSAVPNVPKPMALVGGRPFLEHLMDYWINQGVTQFVISVGYMKEVIMDYFASSYRSTPIEYAIEVKPLGTGGGLLLAAQGITEPFLVLNGDTFFEVELSKLMRFHIEKSSEWTFSLFKTNEFDRYMGMDVNENGKIISLNLGNHKQGLLANGGVYILTPLSIKIFQSKVGQKLSLEEDLIPNKISQGANIYGLEISKKFLDIGLPKDYFRANEFINY